MPYCFTAREDGILVQGATGESEVVQAQVQAKIAARTGEHPDELTVCQWTIDVSAT